LWWEAFYEGEVPARAEGRAAPLDVYDVIVVGGGAGGHAAALFAHKRGADVVILEAGERGGGTAYKSSAGMWIPDNSFMRAKGRRPNRDWALRHMAKLAYPDDFDADAGRLGLSEHAFELIEAYYESASPAIDELVGLGLRVIEFPSITGDYEGMVEYHSDLENGFGAHLSVAKTEGGFGGGPHMMAQFAALAAARGIPMATEHRITDVLTDGSGAVVGVQAQTPEGSVEIRARKGVVFATGGYPHNPERMTQFFPARMYGSCAVGTARGDFIAIAERLGAELGNMGRGWGTEHPLEILLENREMAEHIGVFPGDSYVMVNAAGVRVVNEKMIYHERAQVHYERDADGGFPNHLLFIVYDDFVAYEDSSQPNQWPSPRPGHPWVISGATLEDLVRNIGERLAGYGDRIDGIRLSEEFADRLEETIERFNGFALQGLDEDFHRGETAVELDWTGPSHAANDRNPAMYPLADSGPYHAIIVVGSVLDTNGGPLATPDGQILGADGQPIPGLYGVGNCVASAAGEGYWSGGSTLGPAVAFAYRAAQQVVTEPSRDVPADRVSR
jgi:succinate dehydrogenase/fumarate reductase flavoprotein subunit